MGYGPYVGRMKEMEESKKALHLHAQVWEDRVSMTREKEVRDTPTGGSTGRAWSHTKTDPKGRDEMLNYSSGKTPEL